MKIFVAGLSKSGKTTRSLYVASHNPEVEFVKVSQKLKEMGGHVPALSLKEAMENQCIAEKVLLSIRSEKKHQIIDGHVLIETSEGPMIVGDHLFMSVSPDIIVYIQEAPDAIILRRRPSALMPGEVAALSLMERAACERLAIKLRVPVVVFDSPTEQFFYEKLSEYLDQ